MKAWEAVLIFVAGVSLGVAASLAMYQGGLAEAYESCAEARREFYACEKARRADRLLLDNRMERVVECERAFWGLGRAVELTEGCEAVRLGLCDAPEFEPEEPNTTEGRDG